MNDKHKEAMRKGREAAIQRQREAAVKRVKSYRTWLRKDVLISDLIRRGERVKREPIPVIPSDYDYAVAREEGAI